MSIVIDFSDIVSIVVNVPSVILIGRLLFSSWTKLCRPRPAPIVFLV